MDAQQALIQQHLKTHSFSTFQCIHCKSGFEHFSEIKEHMSLQHADNFLFVVARMSKNAAEDPDEGQFVYMGDMRDSAQYSLSKCCDFEVLSYMDAFEMSPEKLFQSQQEKNRENRTIKVAFDEKIPPIEFITTSNKFFINYHEYKKKFEQKHTSDDGKTVETKRQSIDEQKMKSTVKPGPKRTKPASARSPPMQAATNSTLSSKSPSPSPSHNKPKTSAANAKPNPPNDYKPKSASNNSKPHPSAKSKPLSMPKLDLDDFFPTNLAATTNPVPDEPKPSTTTSTPKPMKTYSNSSPKPKPKPENMKPMQNNRNPLPVNTTPNTVLPNTVASQSVHFKCISAKVAEEILNNQENAHKSHICCDCKQFIEIESMKDYLNHLMTFANHACIKSTTKEKEMVTHRMKKNSKDMMVYLMYEKCSDFVVYKLVRNQFQCDLCDAVFETRADITSHNYNDHSDSYLSIRIVQKIQVIESNDPNQPVKSIKTETDRISYCNYFYCDQHNKIAGTRAEAIEHHNEEHKANDDKFEFSLRPYVLEEKVAGETNDLLHKFKEENNDAHRMYVFECLHCSKFYDSMNSAENHREEIRKSHPNARFTVNKLFQCHENDKIVSTFARLKSHYSVKHPNIPFTPVHILSPKTCGMCFYRYENSEDLQKHYERMHKSGEFFSDAIVRSFQLDRIELCEFVPGCCSDMIFKLPSQIVQHAANCKRRFMCMECPDSTFDSVFMFASHRQSTHLEAPETVANELLNLKNFLLLLSDMTILFPNGLVLAKSAINNTNYGSRLENKLIISINDVFEREKHYLNSAIL